MVGGAVVAADAYAAAKSEALADPDTWRGFTDYIRTICAMQAADWGFAGVLIMTFPGAEELESRRLRAYESLLELIDRARGTGHLSADFASQDLVVPLMANAGVAGATGEDAPNTRRRLVGLMLRAFAAPGAPLPDLPPGPEDADLYRAMVRLTTRAGEAS